MGQVIQFPVWRCRISVADIVNSPEADELLDAGWTRDELAAALTDQCTRPTRIVTAKRPRRARK